MHRKRLLLSLALVFLAACSTTPQTNPYAELFAAERIRSILVVPAVNRSVNVDAPLVLLSTLPERLAESGYYVFPVNTVKVVLEHEGLYEAAEAHTLSTEKLANMFDADSVLYITIEHWESLYVVLKASTRVSLKYRLVSRSGQELWKAEKTIIRDSADDHSNNNALGKLIANAIYAAVEKAKPNFRPLANQANSEVFNPYTSQWPEGPYRLEHNRLEQNKEK